MITKLHYSVGAYKNNTINSQNLISREFEDYYFEKGYDKNELPSVI